MDEETFAFESFRLVSAQRMLLDDGKPLRLGAGRALSHGSFERRQVSHGCGEISIELQRRASY